MKKLMVVVTMSFILSGCICWYRKMSHLTDEDLMWVNCYNVGDTIYFYSEGSNPDTLIVEKKEIDNTRNPLFIHYIDNYVGDIYDASAFYEYKFTNGMKGCFGLKKLADDDSIVFCAILDNLYNYYNSFYFGSYLRDEFTGEPQPKIEFFTVGDKTVNNCVVIDSSNSFLTPYIERENPIESFVVSRDYGLIYYRYANGEEYFRKFD